MKIKDLKKKILYLSFLNCILSAVLSYQLSWLSTVSPSLAKSKQQVLFKPKADYVKYTSFFLIFTYIISIDFLGQFIAKIFTIQSFMGTINVNE